jgi:hypothetical protein
MQTNAFPVVDTSINTTGCCPRFNPAGWDDQSLHFDDKLFASATTASALHVPLNMGRVFARVLGRATAAGVIDPAQGVVLSRELSPWAAEHLFAVTAPVPGETTTHLSGDFLTGVFEGPFSQAGHWAREIGARARARGKTPGQVWFWYTTCPKCAKVYGQNPVVALVAV